MDIQRISDELEIASVLHRYARAVDGKDWDLLRSLFTDDAHLDYSCVGGPAGGREEVCGWLERSLTLMPMTQHFVTNIEADIDGDTATVRAMFYNPMLLPGASETSACGGYYHHVMVRTAGGWRSKQLREENLWFDNPPSTQRRAELHEKADRA
ncbi:nuclear transport factor 2 family protein [Mycobacterium sp. CVI_P3]|uniref:Nuclear transport factor 2 family protein n=1 Tax=Mycobacterium pinniadriaticum TaxID=2994102 RepID=A0ABT3SDZ3_9MYCO|nr:nuclear transport factor 2 family protein [Mycobacterium pinniadriaticum]MCX2931300.1 nuclear transport factor 2 family protein [Mycobacterium pinniadriaticum]MCX2937724.1 nuclear transport factor 2 family protein [Mycobacterium pinniadriaticum]